MAALSGMTGFARRAGDADWGHWAWEAKSVNGRGLDVRVATPPGFDALEKDVKAGAAKCFTRGNMQISLRVDMASDASALTVNEAVLDQLADVYHKHMGAPPNGAALATLMGIKGVVETGSVDLRALATNKAVMADLKKAGSAVIDELAVSRDGEGKALATIFRKLLTEISAQVTLAKKHAGEQPKFIKARLEKQLAEIDAEASVDAERLAVEVALSAAKADVREELDRLSAHIKTGRELLKEGSPVGRKFDFLAQEFNREANTLCSKSASLDLTNAGLSLKGLIDQFKEQAANVE